MTFLSASCHALHGEGALQGIHSVVKGPPESKGFRSNQWWTDCSSGARLVAQYKHAAEDTFSSRDYIVEYPFEGAGLVVLLDQKEVLRVTIRIVEPSLAGNKVHCNNVTDDLVAGELDQKRLVEAPLPPFLSCLCSFRRWSAVHDPTLDARPTEFYSGRQNIHSRYRVVQSSDLQTVPVPPDP